MGGGNVRRGNSPGKVSGGNMSRGKCPTPVQDGKVIDGRSGTVTSQVERSESSQSTMQATIDDELGAWPASTSHYD